MSNRMTASSAVQLVGHSICAANGTTIGVVEELIFKPGTEQVSYVVFSLEDCLAVGNTLFAIPWEAFTLSACEKRVQLDIARKDLESLLGFVDEYWLDWLRVYTVVGDGSTMSSISQCHDNLAATGSIFDVR